MREFLRLEKKDRALRLLKRKKAIEKRYGQIEINLENLQGLIDQIKETQQQQEILSALDSGNKAMKELHKIMSPEHAERYKNALYISADTQLSHLSIHVYFTWPRNV